MTNKHTSKKEYSYMYYLALYAVLLYSESLFAVADQPIGETIKNLAKSTPNALWFFSGLSVTAGVVMIFYAVFKLKSLADFRSHASGQTEIAKIISLMIIGGIFVWMPYMIDVLTYTVFQRGVTSLNSIPIRSQISYDYVLAMTQILQVVGVVSFVRGFFILSTMARSQPQPGTMGKAATHIIAGVFLINIVAFVRLVENTFGVTFGFI